MHTARTLVDESEARTQLGNVVDEILDHFDVMLILYSFKKMPKDLLPRNKS